MDERITFKKEKTFFSDIEFREDICLMLLQFSDYDFLQEYRFYCSGEVDLITRDEDGDLIESGDYNSELFFHIDDEDLDVDEWVEI